MNISGFSLVRNWKQLDLHTAISSIEWEQPEIRVFGRSCFTPRLVAWFGNGSYSYSGKHHDPAPMPNWISVAKQEIEVLTKETFNSVLLNYYRDGRDSVAWHADDEPELGLEPTIASWTIGEPRKFAVKSRYSNEQWSLELGRGDLLIMNGKSQLNYLHSIPKTKRIVGPRLNLTFRNVQ